MGMIEVDYNGVLRIDGVDVRDLDTRVERLERRIFEMEYHLTVSFVNKLAEKLCERFGLEFMPLTSGELEELIRTASIGV